MCMRIDVELQPTASSRQVSHHNTSLKSDKEPNVLEKNSHDTDRRCWSEPSSINDV